MPCNPWSSPLSAGAIRHGYRASGKLEHELPMEADSRQHDDMKQFVWPDDPRDQDRPPQELQYRPRRVRPPAPDQRPDEPPPIPCPKYAHGGYARPTQTQIKRQPDPLRQVAEKDGLQGD